MKNFFKRIGNYNFWVSFSAALILLLNALGNAFGFKIENQIVEDCVLSIAGILVVLGIVTMGDKKKNSQELNKNTNSTSNIQEYIEGDEKVSFNENIVNDNKKQDVDVVNENDNKYLK